MNSYSEPYDTTIESARVQFDVLRKLDISKRADMTFELSNNLRKLTESGIRHRHPDYDEDKVRLAVLKLTLGADLFRKAIGSIEVDV